jgi:hypothetical protein
MKFSGAPKAQSLMHIARAEATRALRELRFAQEAALKGKGPMPPAIGRSAPMVVDPRTMQPIDVQK